MEEYNDNFWANDASPGVVLKHPGRLTDKGFERLRRNWDERHAGPANARRTAILEEGMDITTPSIPQGDAQFLESQKFTRQEIAALFGVPSHMINDLDRATFSNIEEQAQEFIDYALTPYIVGWQEAIRRDLLTPSERDRYYAHHRTQALLRGNHTSRAQFYQTGLQWGWFTHNEVRELEDMNPFDAGDQHFFPLNQSPITEFSATPAAPPPGADDEN
jgi:HK97 family phage portal protein